MEQQVDDLDYGSIKLPIHPFHRLPDLKQHDLAIRLSDDQFNLDHLSQVPTQIHDHQQRRKPTYLNSGDQP